MKQIKTMTKEDLLMGSVDLISKTYIELGQNNVEEDTITVMAQSLAGDLSKIYKNFYFEDAINAFHLGVRSPINSDFIHLTVPLYMKWLRKHKDLIWDARAKVDRGEDPKQVPHFRPEPKLLK
jgi:hypothetical protein|tara:strand:- start:263 stop:631 length:369 start_codon:yes stop_codon:yes gene_type:complete